MTDIMEPAPVWTAPLDSRRVTVYDKSIVHTSIRLPVEWHRAFTIIATRERRTLHSTLLIALEEYLQHHGELAL